MARKIELSEKRVGAVQAAYTAKEADWQRRIGQWQRSGMSQAAFCRRHGLALATFSWWRARLKHRTPQSSCEAELSHNNAAQATAFIPVHIQDEPSANIVAASWACEIAGPHGVSIRCRRHPTPQRLQNILSVLAGMQR